MSLLDPRIGITWKPRDIPLAPAAVAAWGRAAAALAHKVLARPDEALARLRGIAAPELIVLVGEEEELPWVDGAHYLGKDEAAPALLLPTARGPALPLPLLERALLARFPNLQPPLAVLLLDPNLAPRIVSLSAARPIAREVLEEWLAALRLPVP